MTTTGAIKERPLLMQGDLVRASIELRKPVTRRIRKDDPQPAPWAEFDHFDPVGQVVFTDGTIWRCRYGVPGDRLWIRETWCLWDWSTTDEDGDIHTGPLPCPVEDCMREFWRHRVTYRADDKQAEGPWRPGIHMPRWACRLVLSLDAVAVERIQAITYDDCCLELGAPLVYPGPGPEPYRRDMIGLFRERWNALNTKRGFGWDANPMIWVLRYTPIS